MIKYGDLPSNQAHRIRDIDRSEFIDGEYRVVQGALVLEDRTLDAPGWSDADVAGYVTRLQAALREGGCAIGAWSEGRLVGVASLDVGGVGDDPALLLLDMLYVSREFRGRGIGGELTRRIGVVARSRGAAALYISATPTRATVDAYLRLGAVLVDTPDPVLFEREPEDVHLRLDLAALGPM